MPSSLRLPTAAPTFPSYSGTPSAQEWVGMNFGTPNFNLPMPPPPPAFSSLEPWEQVEQLQLMRQGSQASNTSPVISSYPGQTAFPQTGLSSPGGQALQQQTALNAFPATAQPTNPGAKKTALPKRQLTLEEQHYLKAQYAIGMTPLSWTKDKKPLMKLTAAPAFTKFNTGLMASLLIFHPLNTIITSPKLSRIPLFKRGTWFFQLLFTALPSVFIGNQVGEWFKGKALKRNQAIKEYLETHPPGTTWGDVEKDPTTSIKAFV